MKNTPQAVREAIAIALMIAAVTATAAALLHQPLFILGGFILFLVFYIWRINPQIKAAYQEEAEEEYRKKYADDDTYQPILDRFKQTRDEKAFFEEYALWKQGPHDNEVRLRFLQQAVLDLIDAGCIYRVEELFTDMEPLAAAEGVEERFVAYRAQCDSRIAEIASKRLA